MKKILPFLNLNFKLIKYIIGLLLIGGLIFQIPQFLKNKSSKKENLRELSAQNYSLAQVEPPKALKNIIKQAAQASNTPIGVITAVARIEGGHLWDYSNDKINSLSQPGIQDPVNCQPNSYGAAGPMQFTSSQWDKYKNASGRTNPNICNIYDSIFAASAKLAHDSGMPDSNNDGQVDSNNWPESTIKKSAGYYYGICSDCSANPSLPDCRRLGMSYCDFVVNWVNNSSSSSDSSSDSSSGSGSSNIGSHTFHSHYQALPLLPSNQAVTIMLFENEIINPNGSPNMNEINQLNSLLDNHSGPIIIRIAGMKQEDIYNRLDDSSKLKSLAEALTKINGNFYAIFGNEVNNETEWGGQIDPQGYAKAYLIFYSSVSDHNKIKVAPAALDPFHPNSAVSFINQAKSAWLTADAYAFNVYHVPGQEGKIANNSYLSYQWLIQETGLDSGKPLLLTEFSLKPAEYDTSLPDVASFITETIPKLTGNVVAITPLIRNPCFSVGTNAYNLYIHPGKIIDLNNIDVTNQSCENMGLLISGSGNVCADFTRSKSIDLGKTTEYIYLGSENQTEEDVLAVKTERVLKADIGGQVSLNSIGFPDFTLFQERMVSSLEKNLPQKYAETLKLPGETSLYFKTSIQGQNEAGSFSPDFMTDCGAAPQAEIKVPSVLWGKLAGALRGICTYFDLCSPVNLYQFKLEETQPTCNLDPCFPGEKVDTETLSASNVKGSFTTSGWVDEITDITEEEGEKEIASGSSTIISKFIKKITHKWQDEELMFLSRSQLAGAQETVKNAKLLYTQLPQEIIKEVTPKDKAKALVGDFNYSVALSPAEKGSQPGSFFELREMRNIYCMHLCSQYPYGTNIKDIDPLCPSCDPNDYKKTFAESLEDLILDTSLCQNNQGFGCDYFDPNATQGCGSNQDPVCEGGKCNPFEIGLRKDYEGSGCPLPFPGECDSSGLCVKMKFSSNPSGGYGNCQYKNAQVCVRADRASTGNCAAVCNWYCCRGQ
ncbi:hypothetical protein COT75_04420 [Candidatus Beckwithbacteria bacterium CG10_big_fil_rev_8_21_14_0_10_34_10]|uniref:Uncharacterized protein n=1 Tax=Candidatus Beckwithbacteria bacterium CG10_big_fil_rev_8_21_14_0_10_34_10 TaxID=1974495 RepID=A0A2H0W8C1_9BACT|nr:MAG: hypothetical protein COT75_04420 [Candidatus Beckwithbacteria bacterium CG10_big_fil_rev_8_21_14_0_10_34_10]